MSVSESDRKAEALKQWRNPEDKTMPAKRLVIQLKRGSDGLFVEPDYTNWDNKQKAEYERKEEERRTMFMHVFCFGDKAHNPQTWDNGDGPSDQSAGDHNCGKCNKQDDILVKDEDLAVGEGGCLLLPIVLDKDCDSCGKYENKKGRAFDPETETALSPSSATPELMGWGRSKAAWEAKKDGKSTAGKVFGCHNCPASEQARQADSAGRTKVCREGLFRIDGTNCCVINSAPEANTKFRYIKGYPKVL